MREHDNGEIASDSESLRAYLAQRAWVLQQALMNHLLWEEALRAAGPKTRLGARWVDHDGAVQITSIDQTFVQAHARILRALATELTDCGAEGRAALDAVLALVAATRPANGSDASPLGR
jgi:hypothetical protein